MTLLPLALWFGLVLLYATWRDRRDQRAAERLRARLDAAQRATVWELRTSPDPSHISMTVTFPHGLVAGDKVDFSNAAWGHLCGRYVVEAIDSRQHTVGGTHVTLRRLV